jgi:hypothetical protein
MTFLESIRHSIAIALLLPCAASHLRSATTAGDTTTNLVSIVAHVTDIIGNFGSFAQPDIGDTLTLNLAKPPKHMLNPSHSNQQPGGFGFSIST